MTHLKNKSWIWTATAFAFAFALSARASEVAPVTVVETKYSESYIPGGFDNNDHVQMVVEGLFPNTCYRPATPKVVVNPITREIRIAGYAYKYSGVCLMMMVPYHQTLDVGLVPAGTYRVFQEPRGAPAEVGAMSVGVATSSDADDFLYAPIAQASAERVGDKVRIRVTGSFTDSCMKLVQVAAKAEPKVLVVQPLAEKEARPDCTAGNYPFDETVDVNGIAKGRYLLHVRALNGKAINDLVDL